MMLRMRVDLTSISIVILVIASVASCSKETGITPPIASLSSGFERNRSSVSLDSIQTANGCLSVPNYTLALRQLRSDLPLLEVSTHFSLHSERGVREAFRLLTAYGNFKFEYHSGTDRMDLHGLTQDECKSLSHTASDGTQEEFQIIEAKPDYIMAESQAGNRRSYRWISQDRVEIVMRHKVLDLPCSAGSAFAEVKQILDWSGQLPATLDKTDLRYIDEGYIQSLANAVGVNAADFYQEAPGATPEAPMSKVLITAKLMELAKANVRQELISCNGATPPPAPVPDEPQDPENPESSQMPDELGFAEAW